MSVYSNFVSFFLFYSIVIALVHTHIPSHLDCQNGSLHGLPILYHLFFQFILCSATSRKYYSRVGLLLTKFQQPSAVQEINVKYFCLISTVIHYLSPLLFTSPKGDTQTHTCAHTPLTETCAPSLPICHSHV